MVLESESDELDENGQPITRGLKSIKAVIKKAEKGDIRAFQEIIDRIYGKAHQSIDQNIKADMTIADLIKNVEKDKK